MPPNGSQARREEILRLATTTGLASVEELSQHFGVTASTIRRDLARLTADGRLARTYGGAMALNAHPEASLRQRTTEA
ncbi:DeoR family transcriptional regulator, partial [Streptomyces sp. SID5926]|nr:DeoR family transcriptional regulator [Streptomyces sp. SID5926]